MSDSLTHLAYEAVTRLIAPHQWARQPDLLHAVTTHDQRRMVRALIAAEASTQLLLVPASDWQAGSPGGVLEQVIAGTLAALLWAITPDTQPQPILVVDTQHVTLPAPRFRPLLNALLVSVLAALHDGARLCSVRLELADESTTRLILESDRPGIHTQPEARLRLADALRASGASLDCQQWAGTWLTTIQTLPDLADLPDLNADLELEEEDDFHAS